jgi:DNA polymerase III sliding clamp (beta) subunit (PCNA family)
MKKFLESIIKIAKAIKTKKKNDVLSKMLLWDENAQTLIGTDSQIMVSHFYPSTYFGRSFVIVLPEKIGIKTFKSAEVRELQKNKLIFEVDNMQIEFYIEDADKYPNIRMVYPKTDSICKIGISTDSLKRFIEAMQHNPEMIDIEVFKGGAYKVTPSGKDKSVSELYPMLMGIRNEDKDYSYE